MSRFIKTRTRAAARARRDLMLDYWHAGVMPDGQIATADRLAEALGFSGGDSVRVLICRARRRGDPRAKVGPVGRPVRVRTQVVALLRDGLAPWQIANRLNKSKENIYSQMRHARERGELPLAEESAA